MSTPSIRNAITPAGSSNAPTCERNAAECVSASAPTPKTITVNAAIVTLRRRRRLATRTARRRAAIRGDRMTLSRGRLIMDLLERADQLQLRLELDPCILAHLALDP